MDVLGKFDDDGINPVDNPNIYNIEGYILSLTPGEVQDRTICNTRECYLNLIGWFLRFNDLPPFTVFDYFSHPFYRINISFL